MQFLIGLSPFFGKRDVNYTMISLRVDHRRYHSLVVPAEQHRQCFYQLQQSRNEWIRDRRRQLVTISFDNHVVTVGDVFPPTVTPNRFKIIDVRG
jgi:hypothetical protein